MSYDNKDSRVEMTPEAAQEKKKQAEALCRKQDVLEAERKVTENTWQECLQYIIPRKGDVISTRPAGDKRGNELFDSTAIHSNELLAAALHGMLTNPAQKFLELFMGDPDLDGDEDIRKWCQLTSDKMFNILNNSNFQTEIHEIYLDLGAIGTSALFVGSHDKNVVHFSARAMKEMYIDEDNLGRIDTAHRKFQWKLRQIVQEFGEKSLTSELLRKYKDGVEEPFNILHAVYPMMDEKKHDHPKKHTYASCYLLQDQQHYLSEDGFRLFPYAIPRWTKTSGEKYGRGPGQSMLPDIKMVNVMMETTLQGGQLTAAPPFAVTDDAVIGRVRLTPFGMTVVKKNSGDEPIRSLITNARVDFGYQAVEDIRGRIRAGFYIDQFQMSDGPQKTAQEVMQRTEENLRLMGPVLGRQHFEFLDPVTMILFDHMDRAGLVPQMPPKLVEALKKGKAIQVRYSSLIARAQRMAEGQNLTRALSIAGPVIQAIPETLDLIDGDKALKYIFNIYGVPAEMERPAREISDRRKSRAAANEKAAQQAEEQHKADIASKVMPGAAQLAQAEAQ
jgi:hypothetical protein